MQKLAFAMTLVMSVSHRRLFKFDEAKRSFTFPIVIEDEKTPRGRITNKLITYRFNGSYFVKAD